MLYRIQSLYLLFALITASFAATYNFSQPLDLKVFETLWVQNHFPGRFFILSGLFSLLSMVFFKKRMLQLKINWFNISLNVVFIIIFFYFLYHKYLSSCNYVCTVNIYISAALIIFFLLANKFIKKDESLIRSVDRIR